MTRVNTGRLLEIDRSGILIQSYYMSHPISESELEAALSGLPGWSVRENQLCKDFTFESFREAVAAIVRISYEIEETNHHPEMINSYNKLEIRLCTHDVGSEITHKDIRLAGLIEKVLEQWA